MKKIKTKIKGLFILQGKKFTDKRGWLKETFKEIFNSINCYKIPGIFRPVLTYALMRAMNLAIPTCR